MVVLSRVLNKQIQGEKPRKKQDMSKHSRRMGGGGQSEGPGTKCTSIHP